MKKPLLFLLPSLLLLLWLRLLLIGQDKPDIGGVENNVVYFTQRLLRGEALYSDPSAAPWAIAQYPPLYYHAAAAAARVYGAGDSWAVFLSGRVLALLFNLLFALAAGYMGAQCSGLKGPRAAALGAFAFLYLDITAYARPDSLYLLFWAGALGLFCAGGRAMALSGIAAALALFSKQSAILLPLLCGGYLLWNRNVKGLVWWSAGWGLALLFLLLLCQSPEALYLNAVRGLDNGLSPHWFYHQVVRGYFLKWGLVPLALSGWLLWHWRLHPGPPPFARWAWIVSFIFGLVTSLKFGSTPGYFTEWTVLTLMLTLYAAPRWWPALALPPLIWGALQLPKAAAGFGRAPDGLYRREEAVLKRLDSLQGGADAPLFFNLYSPESFLNNLRPRRAVLPQFEVVIFTTWNRQVYDYSGFRKALEGGAVPWMITRSPAPAFMDLPLNQYRLADSLGGYYFYRHNLYRRP